MLETALLSNLSAPFVEHPVGSPLPMKGEQKRNGKHITVSTNEIYQLDFPFSKKLF